MRKALLVGVNEYPEPYRDLKAPEPDAKLISKLLSSSKERHYNFDCKSLIGSRNKVTEEAVMKGMEDLFLKGQADIALFYFAGHGDGKHGGHLVTQDAKPYDLGVSISTVMAMAADSEAEHKIIILDCCYSGNIGNMGLFEDDDAFIPRGMTILASSGSDETSLEVGGSGFFSRLLIDALRGSTSDVLGNISVANLYTYVNRYLGPWDQRPHFKANVSDFPILRKAEPEIALDILKELPEYFETADALHQLSPEYDNELNPPNAEKEAIFKKFRALHRVGLLVPHEEDFLYHAAKYSKACKLTFKGQYYWKLAASDKLG